MNKALAISLTLILILGACTPLSADVNSSEAESGLHVTVSIASVQWLVDQIAGGLVQTQSLTTSGDDPHTYEPSPSQMTAMASSDVYFATGIGFEEVWLPKFIDANSKLQVIDLSDGIELIPLDHEHHHDELDDHDEHHEHEGLDPHIWLSPANMEIIAANIAATLQKLDPENGDSYQQNLADVLLSIRDVDQQLEEMLSERQRAQFLIFHPSLGYIAHDYALDMISVEVDGQEPSPSQLAEILSASETYGIHTLLTQSGINPVNAQVLAEQAGIDEIIELDPLAYDWADNMLFIGKSLQNALN